jgi:hypothetical protein
MRSSGPSGHVVAAIFEALFNIILLRQGRTARNNERKTYLDYKCVKCEQCTIKKRGQQQCGLPSDVVIRAKVQLFEEKSKK